MADNKAAEPEVGNSPAAEESNALGDGEAKKTGSRKFGGKRSISVFFFAALFAVFIGMAKGSSCADDGDSSLSNDQEQKNAGDAELVTTRDEYLSHAKSQGY